MNGLFRYIGIYTKRILKLCPMIIIGTVILCIGILLGAGALLGNNENSGIKKLVIGVVGELDNSFFQSGINALQSLDSTRYIIDIESVDREEAETMLSNGELTAYIIIPDGFVESVMYGTNDKVIDYVCGEWEMGLTSNVMEELVDSFAEYIIESQSGIYGVQDVSAKVSGRELTDMQLFEINRRYIQTILNREKMCNIETLGVGHRLSMISYYFCGLLAVLLMLSGINSMVYFTRRSREMQRLYIARGHNIYEQLLGEYVPYLGMIMVELICVWLTVSVAIAMNKMYIMEWNDNQLGRLWTMLPKMIPVAMLVAALHFLVYELVDNVISSILLQFILSVCLGYVSGCFYPDYYFPDVLQRIGEFMPTKVIMGYTASCILEESLLGSLAAVLVYTVICAAMVIVVRRYRIQGE